MQYGSGSALRATGYTLLFACIVLQSLILAHCQIKDRNVHDDIHGTGSLGRAPWRRMEDTLHETIPFIFHHLTNVEMAIEESLEVLTGAVNMDPDSRVDIQSEGSPTLLAATKGEASLAEPLVSKLLQRLRSRMPEGKGMTSR